MKKIENNYNRILNHSNYNENNKEETIGNVDKRWKSRSEEICNGIPYTSL